MTLETIAQHISQFTSEPLQPELFATLYDGATLKLFLQRYAEKDYFALRKFKKVKGDTTQPLIVTDGVAIIPSDLYAIEDAYYKNGSITVRINMLDDKAFDVMCAHKIEFPSKLFPIGNVQANYIRFRPLDVKYVTLSYFAKPEPVTYAVISTNGYAEFNADVSSPVLWNESDVVFIEQFILQSLGISVNQTDLIQKQNQK